MRHVALVALASLTLVAPFAAPHDPAAADVSNRLAPPSSQFPLGTDGLGRCVLSRMLYAARVTMLSAAAATSIAMLAGTTAGVAAGYWGAWTDSAVGYLVNVFLAFPALLLALIFAAILGPGLGHGIVALSASGWTRYARVVRAIVRTERRARYVDASRAMGATPWHIVRVHVLPSVYPAISVMAMFGLANTVLSLSVLSFLGLGVVPPTPEWGAMIESSRPFLSIRPGLLLWPAGALIATMALLHWIGETTRENTRLDLRVEQ